MATSTARSIVEDGDLVIVFASRDRPPTPLHVQKGEQLVNLFGNFPHDEIIGKPYGSKVFSKNQRGFIYILRPTPELWTLSLPHRTQILYTPDIAFILMKLNLSPGASVIEAGTGSGSFTHALARAVGRGAPACDGIGQTTSAWKAEAPISSPLPRGPCDGRVWSFEFHAERAEKAQSEFAAHGIDRTVLLEHRNVCKDGFGVDHAADAIFLDLPAPWDAVPFALDALRSDVATRICCFSPCIEQVLRSVTALSEHGFTDVSTYESLIRTHETLTNVAPLEPISTVVEKICASERKREGRREMQIANSRLERERRRAAEPVVQENETANEAQKLDISLKRKADDEPDETQSLAMQAQPNIQGPPAEMLFSAGFRQKVERRAVHMANVCSRPYPQMRGHTSYLTFATLLPRD
ncbi:guanidinoacetate N-methyltransferase [Malassezia vespertilionis]|uniref:tRNA (adenine(58)-N(1))-methyltransferase catalytic subunit TRM61 n=1 Tax=Malassezia vespertilionis TaxID=2020962 RepID=A0A2N1JA04_9BASI|nr:guanidinoacetate N-methyltransferase [Malassezia vespertilionis]PKI83312.1 Trm61p [Malassezia vespertilionis]WFD07592.1 guanidinoacetate N-methyltransferase [Malassezia vespertilionis]